MRRYEQYEEVSKEPIRTKDMLLSLCQSRPAILKLRDKGQEYDPLIDIIAAIDINADDQAPLPSSKDLQTRLALKPAKLKKWLYSLYEDFLTTIRLNADMIQITEVEHMFCVYGHRNFVSFSCRLPVTPRIGESVSLPFVTAHMRDGRHGSYYVYRIDHEYFDNKVIITIWVRVGTYNQHAEYLRDRAEFEGKLGRIAQFDMDEYEIEKRLKEIYGS